MKRSGKFYSKNEKLVMKRLGLKPTIASGAGWVEKEDGYNEHILAQLKSTNKQSISIKLLDLQKLECNALVERKIPIFVIQFLGSEEVYIISKLEDLCSISKYIETGIAEIKEPVIFEECILAKKEVIKSSKSSKNNFWKGQEKKWQSKKLK